jgi:hypothetical protein
MYAHHNSGKRSVEKEAEEEQFRDILLLMELLTNLLSKDFIDLAPPGVFSLPCSLNPDPESANPDLRKFGFCERLN